MKMRYPAAIVAALALVALSACSDNGNGLELPSPSISGSPVTKAQLLDALWGGEGVEATADAKCLVGSHFRIAADNGFDIMRAEDPFADDIWTYHPDTRNVIIVSTINIAFDDSTIDGRGSDCAAEGTFAYALAASKADPLSIETSDELAARQNLFNLARSGATPYPRCMITAYFEKDGVESCGPATPTSDKTDPEETPATAAADDNDQASGGGSTSGSTDGNTSGNGGTISFPFHPIKLPFPRPFVKLGAQVFKASEENTTVEETSTPQGSDGENDSTQQDSTGTSWCGNVTTGAMVPIRGIKLVVDGIDCRVQLKPGQQAPWDTREQPNHRPSGPVYSRPNSNS
jgi:hypothetical protein